MSFNQASLGSSPTRCKYLAGYNLIPAMGNHYPCEKFPQKNYNGDNTHHSNLQRSEPSRTLEEEEEKYNKKNIPRLRIESRTYTKLITCLAEELKYNWRKKKKTFFF